MTPKAIRRVLVTGAAGKTGRAVMGRLTALESPKFRLRAFGRHSAQRGLLEEAGADEVLFGDLTDRAALERAFDGVDAIYHICPNMHPEEVSIGHRMIDLARGTGLQRFVFHSVLEPRIREMPHHWSKAQVEDLLADSSLDFTILRPAPYMQNVLAQQSSLYDHNLYRVPYALSTRVSMVDLDDVAEAAARVLASSAHSGATYELCAPGLLDQSDIAVELGRALGRSVRAEPMDRATWADSARSREMSNYQVEALLAMFRYYERSGMAGSHQELETLLERPPTSFGSFAERAFAGS